MTGAGGRRTRRPEPLMAFERIHVPAREEYVRRRLGSADGGLAAEAGKAAADGLVAR